MYKKSARYIELRIYPRKEEIRKGVIAGIKSKSKCLPDFLPAHTYDNHEVKQFKEKSKYLRYIYSKLQHYT